MFNHLDEAYNEQVAMEQKTDVEPLITATLHQKEEHISK